MELSRVQTRQSQKGTGFDYPRLKIIWGVYIIFVLGYFGWKREYGFMPIMLILSAILYTFPIHKRRLWTMMVLYFVVDPLIISCILLLLVLTLYKMTSVMVFVVFIMIIIPAVSTILLLSLFRKPAELQRAKIALEYNNAIFTILATTSVIYAYSTKDFSYLKHVFNLQKLNESGFQPRDAFNYLKEVLSFPLLASTTLCKAFVEHRIAFLEKNHN